MALPTNDDFSNHELSVDALDAIAAGSFWSWIRTEIMAVANGVHVIHGSKDHPPLPSGGPAPFGGPHRV